MEGAVGGEKLQGAPKQELVEEDARAQLERTQEELKQLRGIVVEQVRAIQLLEQRIQEPPPRAASPARRYTSIRPRDIPTLQLSQLDGIKAAGTLNLFLDQIESCSIYDEERVNIAKARVGPEIALLLRNVQEQGKANTWAGVKTFFRGEFAADITFDRGWKEVEGMKYDWAESPQAFTNTLICKYALLESTYPRETLPNRDQFIKKKLWRGLTKDTRDRVETFLDEGYPLNKFITRLEFERQFLLERAKAYVCAVPEDKPKTLPEPKVGTTESPIAGKSEMEEL